MACNKVVLPTCLGPVTIIALPLNRFLKMGSYMALFIKIVSLYPNLVKIKVYKPWIYINLGFTNPEIDQILGLRLQKTLMGAIKLEN
jgi:hypothetical protein